MKSVYTRSFHLIASLLLCAAAISGQAATTFTTTTTATGSWSTPGNWAGGTAPTGNQAGNIAANGAANITLTLDVATTIGQIQDTRGSAQLFTINASGTTAMTFDNTGGVNNPLARADAFIGETSSGPVTLLPNIIIQNTDLDLANTGSTSPTLTIGTLGTSTITATTPQNLFIFQNQATSTKSININSTIGSSGSVITVQNVSTGGGASVMNLNGVVGPNAAVVQNSTNSILSLNAANTYTGTTTINLGTLRLGLANAIPSASSVNVNNDGLGHVGVLNMNGFSGTIDGLTGAGMVTNSSATAVTLTVGGNNTGGTFSGVITNGSGALSLTKTGSGTEILSGQNGYSGVTTINGGFLNAGSAANPGISGPFGRATTAGSIVFGGGTLQYSALNNFDYSSRFSTAANQPISLDVAGQTVSFATALTSSGGSLTLADSVGGGKLTLTAVETYSGNTTVKGGTLVLSGSGALAGGSTISIGTGGTFDVSSLASPYALGGSATLKGSGTGTAIGTTAANIVAASGGIFDAGSRPISLTWGGGSSGTDSTHPALNVSQGTLDLSGNIITVVVPGTALTAGIYTLISAPAISGTPNATPSYTGGNGVAPGYVGSISVSGGDVILTVVSSGTVGTWTDASGTDNNWSTVGNWTGGVPHLAGDSAIFGSTVSAVILDTAEAVGSLEFNQAGSYTLSGANTLTLDNAGAGAAVKVSGGTANAIQTAISLNDNTAITVSGGDSLSVSGNISSTSTAQQLTAIVAGTLALSGNNSYGPPAGSVGTTVSGGGILQVGNISALGAGDVNVSGNSTIQAGASGLSVGNNINIADATTVDNNGNDLTLSGVISGGGSLTKTGNHTLTLGGNNSYTGSTVVSGGILSISADANMGTAPGSATPNSIILNGGYLLGNGSFALNATRGIGIGATTGSTPGTAPIDAASGQTFEVDGVIASAGNGGANSLTVNSGMGDNGTVVLGGANIFAGTTTISNGTLQLANPLALQNSTLNYSSGTLTFTTNATLGGLSGTQAGQNLNLVNSTAGAVALTVGGNGASTSYSGNLSGPGSLTMNGTGTLILGNANYTSNTIVNSAGVLTITGGSFGSSSSTMTVGNGTGAPTLNFSGNGTVTANTVNVGPVAGSSGSSMTITGGASANFTTVNLGAAGNYIGNFTIDTTGTVALGAVTHYKDENANGPDGTAAGLVISAGTVTASSLIVQGTGSSGAATVNMRGGSLTIGNSSSSGAFEIGNGNVATSTRGGWLEMTGGILTYLGTDGLLMGNVATTATGATISGGTANLTGITLNQVNAAGLANSLTVSNGATLYLGGVGLVLNQPSSTNFISLGNGGATVGALADWSSVAPITLAGPTIFQAADASSAAHNISLGDAISGTGSITKTGGGTLTLSGINSFINGTTVNAGTLNINGINALGGANFGGLTLNGATLQYAANSTGNGSLDLTSIGTAGVTLGAGTDTIDVNGNNVIYAGPIGNGGSGSLTVQSTTPGGVLNLNGANTYPGNTTVASGAALGGNGSISGAVEIKSGGILAPGNGGVGTITIGSLTLDSGAIGNFEFNGVANDEVVITNTLTLNDPSDNVAFNLYQAGGTLGITQPGTYNLIQYSGSAPVLDSSWTTTSGSNPHVANPQAGFLYSFHAAGGYLIVKVSLNGSAVSGTWTNDADGNWSVGTNWDSNPNVPHAPGDLATFGTGSALRTVTLDANETIGTITMNNNNSFVIAGSGKTLTLDKNGLGASVYVSAGVANQIQTPVSLNDNVTAVVGSGKSLAVSGNIGNATGIPDTLTLNGTGTLTLSGNNNYGPSSPGSFGTILNSGVLQLGSNTALGAGDISFVGNGTLQAGTAGLSLANNLDIASGAVATVDNNGQNITLNGNITDYGSLTKTGNGTLTLNGYNTYVGNTIVNAGVLSISSYGNVAGTPTIILNGGDLLGNTGIDAEYPNIGLGPTNGSVGGTGLIDAASGQLFTLYGSIASAGNTGTNNLVVNSGAGDNGTVYMGTGNTFKGTTVISNGWLEVGSSSALQNSTLDYNNQGGALVLDTGIGTLTLGGLSGAQDLGLTNLSAGGVTLTVGNNNGSTTYSGSLNDFGLTGSLTKVGTGTLTLTGTNSSYNGATTISAGVLQLNTNGVLNTLSASVAAVGGAELIVSGGFLTATNASTIGNPSAGLLVSSGSATFLGGLSEPSANNGDLINVTGGSLTMASLTLGRTALNDSTQPTAGSTGAGLYVNGGAVNILANLNLGTSGGANSSVNTRIDSGSLTVGGALLIGLNNGARWSVVDVNGGSLMVTDVVTGISIGNAQVGNAELLIRNGTVNAGIIGLGYGTVADTVVLNQTNGSLYVGAGGIVQVSTNATASITLAGGLLGANTNWSCTNNIQLTGASYIIRTADTNGNAQNIYLGGTLSGTGALIKMGKGTLVLSNADTCTGAITVSNGTLALVPGGSMTNTPQITIASNATFDVSALAGYTLAGANPVQTLAGFSTAGAANVNVTGNALTLASGAKALFQAAGGTNSPSIGKISVAGDLALTGNVITINVGGGILGAGTYRLLDCTGNLSGTASVTPVFTGLGATPGAAVSISTTTGAGGHVDLTVGKATPILQTATATSILLGQALSNSTLTVAFTNAAGTNVPGTAVFTSPGTVPLVAGTANYPVQFTPADTADYNTPAAFNVAVTVISPVLIPTQSAGITGFSITNGNVLISGTNGETGGTYYLLASTDLGLPLSQWLVVATNVVNTNGNSGAFTFIGTNAAGAGAGQKFYILSNTNN